jgi:hypothetical protein
MASDVLCAQMPPEDAFWAFAVLLDRYVPGFFDHGLREVQVAAQVLHGLLRAHDAVLWAHLQQHDVEPILYATDWFLCLFVKVPRRPGPVAAGPLTPRRYRRPQTLPWDSVLRVWDMFLMEGSKVRLPFGGCHDAGGPPFAHLLPRRRRRADCVSRGAGAAAAEPRRAAGAPRRARSPHVLAQPPRRDAGPGRPPAGHVSSRPLQGLGWVAVVVVVGCVGCVVVVAGRPATPHRPPRPSRGRPGHPP